MKKCFFCVKNVPEAKICTLDITNLEKPKRKKEIMINNTLYTVKLT